MVFLRRVVLLAACAGFGSAAFADDGVAALTHRCTLVSVMAMGAYSGPDEARIPYAQAITLACIDHLMPTGWPGHEEMHRQEQERFFAAWAVNPNLTDPDPVWEKAAKD